MTRHYLDHASTSPLRPPAAEAIRHWLEMPGGDPGRLHSEALEVRYALEGARERVAALLGARSREVVFTSGATESVNAAIEGTRRRGRGDHVVVTAVEHSCVRLAAERGPHTVVGVDGHGRVDPEAVLAAIRPDTGLVCVQWANHEMGTVQPVADIVPSCRERGVLTLVDAATAAGHLPIDTRALGVDLLAVSGHKLGAPPGVGVLIVRRGIRIEPLLVGSDQERARRAGLENVPGILGLGAVAAALHPRRLDEEIVVQARLADRLRAGLAPLDGVTAVGHPNARMPHLVCVTIDDVEPQAVLLALDRAGVAAHSGSACASEDLEPSPVLAAMGVEAHRSLRLSVGWSTTEADVDAAVAALPPALDRLRALRRG